MKVFLRLFACLVTLGFTAIAQNQNLLVLPGSGINSPNVSVYSAQPFTPGANYVAGNASFAVFAKPDGSKYYTVASAGAQTVTVTDGNFGNPRSLGNVGTQATAAALTPDGTKLFVAAGTLQVFDTASDTNVGTISPGSSVGIFDVAMGLDGAKAFTLGTLASGGSQLNSVDIAGNRIFGTLPIPGQATGVAVGPDGMVYVSTQNRIFQIDPNTLTVTPAGTIQLNARPGRPVFTPDGKYLVAVNQTPVTGYIAVFVDLSTLSIAGTITNQFSGGNQLTNITLDQLLVVNASTLLAYSSSASALYPISIASGPTFVLNPTPYTVPGTNPGGITAAALSNEVTGVGRTTPQYLFVVQSGTLYRVDLTSNSSSGQYPLANPSQVGALAFAGGAFTGQPVSLFQYGNNQVLTPGGLSHPIVVRAIDQNGHALSGVTVTWSANVSTAVVSPNTSTTGFNGYAVTYLTAPATNGIINVTATAGAQGAVFSLSVGTGTGGTAGALNIVAGQGQLTVDNNNTGQLGFGTPFIVQAVDVNGAPVAGANVTFTLTQGPGSIVFCGLATYSTEGCTNSGQGGVSPNTVVAVTDANGKAAVSYISSNIVPNGLGYAQTVVNASSPGTNSRDFYITTTLRASPPTVQLLRPEIATTISGQAGTVAPGAVLVSVVSSLGAPIPNVSVQVNNGGLDPTIFPSATCADPTGNGLLTDASGLGSCDLKFGGKTGIILENAFVGYAAKLPNFFVQVTNGPPGKIVVVQGNNQSGKPGQTLPLAFLIQVQDSFGNVLAGVPVTWQVLTPGAITIGNVTNTTDANGRASSLGTLGGIAGTAQVKVTAGGISTTFSATVTIPASGMTKVSGDGQSTQRNTQFTNPLVVQIVDSSGNGIAGLPVAFSVTSGSATVLTPTATTNSSGQASTLVTAGSAAGSIVVTATYSTFTTTFNLTSLLPGPQNITVVNGASFLPGVSPGSIALISGAGILTGVQGTFAANQIIGPLPTSFPISSSVGTGSVRFNNILAPVYYVSNVGGQELIAVQVPFEIQPGTVTLTINAVGGGTASISVTVSSFSPGIFETIYSGQKFAAAVHADGTPISPGSPARRGENIRIYATGLGQVRPTTVTNAVGQPSQPVNASVIVGLNNGGVRLIAAEYAPNLVGVYVITLQVPTDTQTGPYQPVGLFVQDTSGNLIGAQGTFIPIQ
jgi:uncharacterized protein (TIGR03437 family)